MRPKPIVAHRRHKNTAMMSKEPKSNAEVMKGLFHTSSEFIVPPRILSATTSTIAKRTAGVTKKMP